MNSVRSADHPTRRRLPRPGIQYRDGKIVTPPPLDVQQALVKIERLDPQERAAFLCIFAHDLTVQIRSMLLDRPVSEVDLDRVFRINEYLHQLTNCVNPAKRWSLQDEVALVGTLIDSSYKYGLESVAGSALAKAAGNGASPQSHKISKDGVAAYGEKIVEAELLRNGWLPANVNETVSNAANFDIFAQKGDRIIPIQVKTCGPEKDEFTMSLLRTPGPNELTVLVKMAKIRETDQIYVIPTRELHKDIAVYRDASMTAGIKDIDKWTLRLHESTRFREEHRRYTYGFARKWEKWLNNWQQLEPNIKAGEMEPRSERDRASEVAAG
jgi:hypothetical protein